jgi:hypothetical protein
MGRPRGTYRTHAATVFERAIPVNGCLIWTGARSGRYGQMRLHGRVHFTHRVAYELARGPIPDGLTVDHLCENTLCVYPAHLDLCTSSENSRRAIARWRERRIRCLRGHQLTAGATYKDGRCRECHRLSRLGILEPVSRRRPVVVAIGRGVVPAAAKPAVVCPGCGYRDVDQLGLCFSCLADRRLAKTAS